MSRVSERMSVVRRGGILAWIGFATVVGVVFVALALVPVVILQRRLRAALRGRLRTAAA
ncbi:MAG: hypothetical protein K1X88_06275 [Nannocystaceae bacterium]|nr:hypothetical protein [Nannocystaceae bacterium]